MQLIWGPLCIATVVSIVRDSPMRHPLQVVVCVGHLYGAALYLASSVSEMYLRGVSHSRPEFLYFWVYFVGLNLPWAIVPSGMLPRCLLGVGIRGRSRCTNSPQCSLPAASRPCTRPWRS
jgi:hypothetical protein